MDRRYFIKALGLLGAASIPANLGAQEFEKHQEFVGVLTDTTRCIGCRQCEEACAREHGLPDPGTSDSVFKEIRNTSPEAYTVVNRYQTEEGTVYVKKQCMHCSQPACTAACLTKAMYKTKEGPVIWRSNKCMGCRYCMVSCPFEIPKFEYHSPIPKIQKCNMCWERQQEGKMPACVEACPVGVMIFGKRRDVLQEAMMQMYKQPEKYYREMLYGQHIVGGTGWTFLSPVPFEQLGFRTDLGITAYPEYTKEFLYAVPVILALWPPMLWAVSLALKEAEEE